MPPSANATSSLATSKPLADVDDGASMKSASPAGTSTSSGTKRKRVTEPKFYAVRVGYHPGIYHSWKDCLEQVKGFKNATFKSFPSLTDAELFIAGEDPGKGTHGISSSPPYKFYAVRSGRVPGIYTDWPSAQKQITGWQKPKQKCFSTRAEAQRFLDEGDPKSTEKNETNNTETQDTASDPTQDGIETSTKGPVPKRAKKNVSIGNGYGKSSKTVTVEYNEDDYEPGAGPLPPGAEDGFDPNITLDVQTGDIVYRTQAQRDATRLQAIGPSPDAVLRIHTDGSSIGNGTEGAIAGVGVYFGPEDRRNLSEALPGPRQTNQRAELTAILRALDSVPRDRDVAIITDSRYAIDCVTVWYVNWRKNGWRTSAGKPVENKDIVENVLVRIDERNTLGSQTQFEWIKGHARHPGNEAADRLAVDGAKGAAALLKDSM